MPFAGTFRKLYVRIQSFGTAPVGASVTYTLRKNGSDTAITCSVVAAAFTCSDTSNSVTFAAGDAISLQWQAGGGIATQPDFVTITLGYTIN
jgi:hypothetical protein